jgi:hypothetical protein
MRVRRGVVYGRRGVMPPSSPIQSCLTGRATSVDPHLEHHLLVLPEDFSFVCLPLLSGDFSWALLLRTTFRVFPALLLLPPCQLLLAFAHLLIRSGQTFTGETNTHNGEMLVKIMRSIDIC